MSNNYKFVSDSLENEISELVLPSIFPNLNSDHKALLKKYIVRLINMLALIFEFRYVDSHGETHYGYDYEYQLKQNNYQDIKWLINHLLPYINEEGDLTKINSLNDVYLKKKINVDINSTEPKYVYSNLQYNRCDRTPNNFKEIDFSEKDINDNFCILIDTLKTMSYKMHVNWVDILPYTLKDYKNSDLYIYTHEKITAKQYTNWDPINCGNFSLDENTVCRKMYAQIVGLSIEDMYNTISNDLYQSIKNIKWLIYDVYTSSEIYPIVTLLRIFFDLSPCLAQIDWEDFAGKTDFELMWINFVSAAEKGGDITYGSLVISNKSLVTLLSGIILSFDKGASKNTKTEAEENGYVQTPKTKDYLRKIGRLSKLEQIDDESESDDDADDENGSNLSFDNLLPSLKSLKIRHLFDFITESLQKFKNTWYGTKLLTPDKKNVLSDFVSPGYTYKNVYNFAKSFVHVVTKNGKPFNYPAGWENLKGSALANILKDTEFVPFPTNWKSLDIDQQTEIMKRLNNKHVVVREWFNIARYIKHISTDSGRSKKDIDVNMSNIVIHKLLMDGLASIVFETLIIKGVLTKFIPNKDKTNRNYVERDDVHKLQSEVFSTSFSNKYWTSSYHYLTNIPYCYMDEFKIDTNPPTNESFNYFSYGKTKDGDWYLIDAYNWVAQIGFCHHFINNRVQFITGATGVGKSTEIPKLFLYYSKAIGWLQNPKIICTEPRIEPTSSNASRIATCLGLPISVLADNNGIQSKDAQKDQQTNNYYIQTKYNGSDAHAKPVSHAMLQYATDGTLILEATNPLMKYNKINKLTEKITFADINTYDIIMIDEAHEHKINMDLLLTIFRHAVTYNNSLKLVILSATMNDDEPKYRRYFRDVNDNKKYPLNTWVRDKKLDRIVVDRRYHISPPATGTRYTVKEYYYPEKSEQEVIKEILSTSDIGDILVFEPSSKKILALVEELNKTLPPHVIALPYFSKMDKKEDEWKKKIIGKINEKLKGFKMDRNIPFSDPIVTRQYMQTGNNVYKRAIIVATNIAEASITLPSLKFVIDTGTQIVNKYDYRKRSEIQETIYISESSRVQRKGRVGRKSSGSVYYLYPKGFLEANTLEYEISTENLSLNLFGRLKQKNTEAIIIDKQHDPNSSLNKITHQDLKNYFDQFGLTKTIKNQYFLGNTYYEYFGNSDIYDYENYQSLPAFYESGFDMCTLTDNRGNFYLIHPNELELQRNIVGQIVGKSDVVSITNSATYTKDQTYSGYINSKKLRSFWQILLDYLYITFNDEKTNILKTTLGTEIIKFFESLKLDESYHGLIRMIIFAYGFGCEESAIRLVAFFMTTSFNPLAISKPIINQVTKKQTYKSGEYTEESESKVILKILNKLHLWLDDHGVKSSVNNGVHIQYYSDLSIVKNYGVTNDEVAILLSPLDKHTLELKNKISSHKVSTIIEKLESELIDFQKYKLFENENEFIKWCDINDLNLSTLNSYINRYLKLKSLLARSITQEMSDLIASISNSFKKASILIERNIDTIELALLFGFPFNICKKMDKSNYYLSLYNPNMDNIYLIASMSKYKYKPMTLITEQHFQKYIMFLSLTSNVETNEDSLACIHKIDPKLFSILSHIYSGTGFKKITKNIKTINEIDNMIKSKLETHNMNLSYAIIGYTRTLKEIEKNLSEYNDLRTVDFMKGFDFSLDGMFC